MDVDEKNAEKKYAIRLSVYVFSSLFTEYRTPYSTSLTLFDTMTIAEN